MKMKKCERNENAPSRPTDLPSGRANKKGDHTTTLVF